MVVLEADLVRVTGTGGSGSFDGVRAGYFVGLEVQASAGVIACGADKVRDSGFAFDSVADIAFVIEWGTVGLIQFLGLYHVTMA
jgi:hypothetical protein